MADALVKWDEMIKKIVCVGRVESASRPAVKKVLAALEEVPEELVYESGMNLNRQNNCTCYQSAVYWSMCMYITIKYVLYLDYINLKMVELLMKLLYTKGIREKATFMEQFPVSCPFPAC